MVVGTYRHLRASRPGGRSACGLLPASNGGDAHAGCPLRRDRRRLLLHPGRAAAAPLLERLAAKAPDLVDHKCPPCPRGRWSCWQRRSFMALTAPYMRVSPTVSEQPVGWLTVYLARFIVTVLPTIGVFVVLGAIALLIVLPPSALVSYFIARGTTRRLENLARCGSRDPGGRLLRPVDRRGRRRGGAAAERLQRDGGRAASGHSHDLQAERDRVAGLLDAPRTLVANVSHELRTPVATVRGGPGIERRSLGRNAARAVARATWR